MQIYYRFHKSHKSEAEFFKVFQKQFRNADYPDECFQVEKSHLSKPIYKPALLAALNNNQFLPIKQRERCIKILNDCPTWIKVALKSTSISFDVVIVNEGKTYFWEYHEDQHRKLKDNRERKIYNAKTDEEIFVPRCVQRLIRDIWRIENFSPFSIIWKDWFEKNKKSYQPQFQTGLNENFCQSKFSFRKFYEIYEGSKRKQQNLNV